MCIQKRLFLQTNKMYIMKLHLTFLSVLICAQVLSAQPCFPDGITFETQDEIDLFVELNPNCTHILGNVRIEDSIPGSITNIEGLYPIEKVDGDFILFRLTGLENMTGLENLDSVGGVFQMLGLQLVESTSALQKLRHVGGLAVGSNPLLTDTDGFIKLENIRGSVTINNNAKLPDLLGLQSIATVGAYLNITRNDSLTGLQGLENLESVGTYFALQRNTNLKTLAALSRLSSVGTYLRVSFLDNLEDLTGLEGITSLGWRLIISHNPRLKSLKGLDNLVTIGEALEIVANDSLQSLQHIASLESIQGRMTLIELPSIHDLSGLENIDFSAVSSVTISNCGALSNCSVAGLCAYLEDEIGESNILENAMGCNSSEEVLDNCSVVSSNVLREMNTTTWFPNPASGHIFCESDGAGRWELLSIEGRHIQTFFLVKGLNRFDMNEVPSGLYILTQGMGNSEIILIQ